jgi:hypothetical protein
MSFVIARPVRLATHREPPLFIDRGDLSGRRLVEGLDQVSRRAQNMCSCAPRPIVATYDKNVPNGGSRASYPASITDVTLARSFTLPAVGRARRIRIPLGRWG